MAQLEKYACMWWPKEIRDYTDKISILQSLLDTQEKFISILKLADRNDPNSIIRIMQACEFPQILFLKHLMVLTGLTSKNLSKLCRHFSKYYPTGSIGSISSNSMPITFHHIPTKARLNDQYLGEHSDICLELTMLIVFSNEAVRTHFYFNDVLELMSLSIKDVRIQYVKELALRYHDFVDKKSLWGSIKKVVENYCA